MPPPLCELALPYFEDISESQRASSGAQPAFTSKSEGQLSIKAPTSLARALLGRIIQARLSQRSILVAIVREHSRLIRPQSARLEKEAWG